MASFRQLVSIVITADGKQAVAEIEKVGAASDKNLTKAAAGSRNLGDQFLKTGAVMVGAGAAIGLGLAKTISASDDYELAVKKLNNTIANQPSLVGASSTAFIDQATALSQTTVASNTAVIGIQALLGQFKLTQPEILKLTPLIVDLSRKMGKDFDVVTKAVGKSINGTAGGLTRMGVIVDKNAEKQDAYNATLKALGVAQGFAGQETQTFHGKMQVLGNDFLRFEQSVGAGAKSLLSDLFPALQGIAGALGTVDASSGQAIGQFAAIASAGLIAVGGLTVLIGTVIKARAALITMAETAPVAAGALSVLGGAFTGVALGVAVGTAAQALLTKLVPGADDARAAVVKFGGDGSKAVEEFKNAVNRSLTSDLFSRGNFSLGGLVNNFRTAFRGITDSSGQTRDAVLKQFKDIADKSPSIAQHLLNALKADPQATAQIGGLFGKLQKDIDGVVKSRHDSAKAAAEDAAMTNAGSAAAAKAAQEEANLAKAIDSKNTALIASFSSQVAAQQATKQLADDLKQTTDPLQQQSDLLNAAGAKAKFAADQYELLTGKQFTATQKSAAFRQALVDLLAQFPQLGGQILPLIAQIDALGKADAHPKVSADTGDSNQKLGDVNAKLDRLDARHARAKLDVEIGDAQVKVRQAEDALNHIDHSRPKAIVDADTLTAQQKLNDALARLHLLEIARARPKVDAPDTTPANNAVDGVNAKVKGLDGTHGKPHVDPIPAPEITFVQGQADQVGASLGGLGQIDATPHIGPLKGGTEAESAIRHLAQATLGLGQITGTVNIGDPHHQPEAMAAIKVVNDTTKALDGITGTVTIGNPKNAPEAEQTVKFHKDHTLELNGVTGNVTIGTNVRPGTYEAIANLGAQARGLNGISANVNIGVKRTGATGGPVRKGEAMTVSERGEELFIPRAGYVKVSAQKPITQAVVSAEGVQASITVPPPKEVPPGVLMLGGNGPQLFVPPTDGQIIPRPQVDDYLEKMGLDPRKVPRRASIARSKGGPVNSREVVLVGEEGREVYIPANGQPLIIGKSGPELFNPPQPGQVYSHPQAERMLRSTATPAGESVPSATVPGTSPTSAAARPPVTSQGSALGASIQNEEGWANWVKIGNRDLAAAIKSGNLAFTLAAQQQLNQDKANLAIWQKIVAQLQVPGGPFRSPGAGGSESVTLPSRPPRASGPSSDVIQNRALALRAAPAFVLPNGEALPDLLGQTRRGTPRSFTNTVIPPASQPVHIAVTVQAGVVANANQVANVVADGLTQYVKNNGKSSLSFLSPGR